MLRGLRALTSKPVMEYRDVADGRIIGAHVGIAVEFEARLGQPVQGRAGNFRKVGSTKLLELSGLVESVGAVETHREDCGRGKAAADQCDADRHHQPGIAQDTAGQEPPGDVP